MSRKYFLAGFALLITCLLVTAILYPHLPARVPSHWNAHGEVDSYAAKWTLFVMNPGIMLGMLGIFAVLPWLSPRHFEVDTFRSTYLYIMLVILTCLTYFHGLLLWAAVSGQVGITKAVMGGVCLLFALLGNVLGKVRRNFYVGIRTPWTIADERVWNATHRLGAKTFVLGGLVALILSFAGAVFWVPVAALLAAAFAPVVYSLVYYKQLERRGELT
jgi:uncharacterized membrane protein